MKLTAYESIECVSKLKEQNWYQSSNLCGNNKEISQANVEILAF